MHLERGSPNWNFCPLNAVSTDIHSTVISQNLPKQLQLLVLEVPQLESFVSVEDTHSCRRGGLAGSYGGYCYLRYSRNLESEPSGLDKSFVDSARYGDIDFAGKAAGNVDIAVTATVAEMAIL